MFRRRGYGTVMDSNDKNACLSVSDKGRSDEKIVHSDKDLLTEYSVNHAPPVPLSNRVSAIQEAVAKITGKTTEFHAQLKLHGLHQRHMDLKVQGWFSNIFDDMVDFGEELWGPVESVCSTISWGVCWSVAAGVIGL